MQVDVRLLPGSERRWRYVLFPLVAGHVALPRLRLSSPWLAQETLDRLAQRSLPTSFFVLVGHMSSVYCILLKFLFISYVATRQKSFIVDRSRCV